jgi:hypothetical protein
MITLHLREFLPFAYSSVTAWHLRNEDEKRGDWECLSLLILATFKVVDRLRIMLVSC